jgi:uncharacterized protein with von Willebrand factor type A (vWA) domain
VKVLLFFDVGGSMDPHVRVCEELFSAARTEFKHMENFYFHNFFYESVWKNNVRRTRRAHEPDGHPSQVRPRLQGDHRRRCLHVALRDLQPGGSVEHWNEEAGEVWLRRLLQTYDKAVWINPVPEDEWEYTQSIAITHQLMEGRMYPLTLKGLEEAMTYLSK